MSDPSQIQVPIGQALTSDMMLGLKPSAPKSRSYRLSLPALNKATFSGGDSMIFEIPCGRKGSWLDQSQSYLKFSVQCQTNGACTIGGTGVYLENSAYGFIQRLDVLNSSNTLESINEYGQLANFLIDTSLTRSDKYGMSPLIGTNAILRTSTTTVAAASDNVITTYGGDRSGQSLASETSYAASIPYTFSLPVLSGIIGINASKMLPIGQLMAPIRCEFILASNDDAIYYGTAGAGATWQLINVELCCCFVEIQDDSLSPQLQQGEQEYISTMTYKQSSTFLPKASSGEVTCLIPFRCASLSAIYARFRNQTGAVQGANATAGYRKSSSVNPNFAQAYFRIGGSMYPPKPINLISSSSGTGSEGYAELMKSFHALGSASCNGSIGFNQYNVASTATKGWNACATTVAKSGTVVDTYANAFAIGLELQSFSNRNDTIMSGVSTLNSQIYFTGTTYGANLTGGTGTSDMTIDFFGLMDMILVIENGIMSAKY